MLRGAGILDGVGLLGGGVFDVWDTDEGGDVRFQDARAVRGGDVGEGYGGLVALLLWPVVGEGFCLFGGLLSVPRFLLFGKWL